MILLAYLAFMLTTRLIWPEAWTNNEYSTYYIIVSILIVGVELQRQIKNH